MKWSETYKISLINEYLAAKWLWFNWIDNFKYGFYIKYFYYYWWVGDDSRCSLCINENIRES